MNNITIEVENLIRKTELFRNMLNYARFGNEHEVIEAIVSMREEVSNGADPEDVLYDEGLEPDWVLDLL